METLDKQEWRKQGGMTPRGRYIPTTSTGRKVIAIKHTTPKKGEVYLKPSGKRGIFNVLTAQNDFARRSYTIVRVVKSESEYRAQQEENRRAFLRVTGRA